MATVATVRQKGLDAVDEGIQALIDAGVAAGAKTVSQEIAALQAQAADALAALAPTQAALDTAQAALASMTRQRDIAATMVTQMQNAIDASQAALANY